MSYSDQVNVNMEYLVGNQLSEYFDDKIHTPYCLCISCWNTQLFSLCSRTQSQCNAV